MRLCFEEFFIIFHPANKGKSVMTKFVYTLIPMYLQVKYSRTLWNMKMSIDIYIYI